MFVVIIINSRLIACGYKNYVVAMETIPIYRLLFVMGVYSYNIKIRIFISAHM